MLLGGAFKEENTLICWANTQEGMEMVFKKSWTSEKAHRGGVRGLGGALTRTTSTPPSEVGQSILFLIMTHN